jgi:hypothetical protein
LHDRGELVHPALHGALAAIMVRGISPDGLGRFLSRYVDRVVGGYAIRKRKHPDTRVKQYLLEPIARGQATKVAGPALQAAGPAHQAAGPAQGQLC